VGVVMAWLARLRGTRNDGANTGGVAVPVRDGLLDEIADLARKCARGQVRLTAKLEEMDASLQGALAELRAAATARSPVESGEALAAWGDVLDVLDTLDHVITSDLGTSDPGAMAQGLRGMAARLKHALSQAHITRVGAPGQPVDPKTLRVVGTEDRADWPDGVISRVVRAGALVRGRLAREGEVFVNKRSPR
jgi:molecular chaperone GrpE (heat shock protein)